jgi:hypothetical protein
LLQALFSFPGFFTDVSPPWHNWLATS